MGIIQRQGIKNSILSYFGAGVGAVSTFLIYPLAIEAYGLLYFLKVAALLCIPFANLGIQTLVIRFFPKFKDQENGHNGFLVFLLLTSAIFFLLFLGLSSLFWEEISAFFAQKKQAQENSLIATYLWYVIPLTYLLINVNILIAYTSNFHRIVIPAILYDFFMKIVNPVLIVLFAYGYLTIETLLNIFLLAHVVTIFLMLFYLDQLKELSFKWPSEMVVRNIKPMANYAIYSVLGSLGNLLATQLDTVMIGGLKTDFETGVFANSLLIASSIAIPQRAIIAITAPLVASAWENKELHQIKSLYQKTSINLLLIGSILFLLILVNLDDLCALLPVKNAEIIQSGKMVIFFLGFGLIIDMATSINGHIIYYSDYYRASFYMILFLGLTNIFLNLYLIPRFGINGAAAATLISLVAYNLLKTIYVYYKFNIHPLTRNTAKLLAIMGLLVILSLVLPESTYPLLNLAYRSIVLLTTFGLLVRFWEVSPEGNKLLDQAIEQIKKMLKKI